MQSPSENEPKAIFSFSQATPEPCMEEHQPNPHRTLSMQDSTAHSEISELTKVLARLTLRLEEQQESQQSRMQGIDEELASCRRDIATLRAGRSSEESVNNPSLTELSRILIQDRVQSRREQQRH